jgi:phenylpropionate dioxygenase-like ring-hydroxylating dioxygenase large terminal subunit
MYINFWYPMALTDELRDVPVRSTALGQDFVLFRDEHGEAHCLANTCLHRGGSLSGGKVQDSCIECPYHGWRYDGDGRCSRIPTLRKNAKIPERARVDSYPVEERYGIVFAFLGDLPGNERPPIMDIGQWDKEGWSVTSLVYDWNASFERVIENGLDATHTEFVHPSAGLQGGFNPDDILDERLIRSDWGSAMQTDTDKVQIEHGHHGPSHQWTFLTFKTGNFNGSFMFYSFVRPIDAHSVTRYMLSARDFQHGEEMDKQLGETTLSFEKEDRPVIETMRPRFSPRDTKSELLLPEDEIMVSYRRYLDAWQAKGWHIDLKAVREKDDRKVFAIPSPGRREHRNWVMEEVPLIQAKCDSDTL